MDLFVGRQKEQAELRKLLLDLESRLGGLVLISGESGVGKTTLVENLIQQSRKRIIRGRTFEVSTPPFGPIVQVLRAGLKQQPDALSDCENLLPYLGLLLPELGHSPQTGDQQGLHAALHCVFVGLSKDQPLLLLLDDLQWADNATLEFLPVLADRSRELPLLIIGIYRSDEIARGHPLRRMRHNLRRLRLLQEIMLEPFDRFDLEIMTQQILDDKPSQQLLDMLLDRTQGVALFVEELLLALQASDSLHETADGIAVDLNKDLPIPDTIRDAVTLRLNDLSESAKSLLDIAAVAGVRFDVEMVTELAGNEDALQELVDHHLILEVSSPEGTFRHALVREVIYKNIIWTHRRHIHRDIAAYLERKNVLPGIVAEHWLAGHELQRGRRALIETARQSCDLHAYRDATDAACRALELWPENEDEALRLDVLDQLGNCAQLCGMLSDAEKAWREVAEGRVKAGDLLAFAETQSRLANIYSLQGVWGRSIAARRKSADAFEACELPAQAATERLAAVAHLHGAGNYTQALALIPPILRDARKVDRRDLLARALGLEGALHSKLGNIEKGLEQAQEGLALALDHNLIGPASEIYQRLASVFEQSADYPAAKDAYRSAVTYCETQGVSAMEQVCIACLAVVLHQTSEWKEGISLARSVIHSPLAPPVAKLIASSMLGLIFACKGQVRDAHRILRDSLIHTRAYEIFGLEIVCTWGLAMISLEEHETDAAIRYCQTLLERWEQTEERHYVIPPLRWSVTLFAELKDAKTVSVCASALSSIAVATNNPEALAGLAHALGEAALLNQNTNQAIAHFHQSLELLYSLEAPFDLAQTRMRYGQALIQANQNNDGVKHLLEAHRSARRMGARPLAAKIGKLLADMGEQVYERLGHRTAEQHKRGGLTRRQHEILKLISDGLTNTQIAEQLTLSIRTVDMHVSNLLTRLDCRSRTEAIRRAAELKLL